MMNDDFLKQYRKQPRPAFAETIYRKINTENSRRLVMKRFALAFAIFLAVITFTLGVSPQARGAALELIREVGGLRFLETSDYPGAGGPVTIVDSTYVSLNEAKGIFPGAISLPVSIPDGYSIDPEVELIDFQEGNLPMAILNWKKTTPEGGWGMLWLRITYTKEIGVNYSELVGEGAIEEITINGQPAVLVSGGWNHDTQAYDFRIPIQSIRWKYDEHTIYTLESSKEAISKEELTKIAESIP